MKARKDKSRKPKVEPVMGSQVKMDKLLKKQMAAMTVSGKVAKQKDSSDESGSDDNDMNGAVERRVPRSIATRKHRIMKNNGISRAEEMALKK